MFSSKRIFNVTGSQNPPYPPQGSLEKSETVWDTLRRIFRYRIPVETESKQRKWRFSLWAVNMRHQTDQIKWKKENHQRSQIRENANLTSFQAIETLFQRSMKQRCSTLVPRLFHSCSLQLSPHQSNGSTGEEEKKLSLRPFILSFLHWQRCFLLFAHRSQISGTNGGIPNDKTLSRSIARGT